MLRLYVYDNNGASTGIDCRFSCLANSLVQRSLLPPLSHSVSLSLYREVSDYATNSACFDFEGFESFEEHPNGHALAPMNCKKVSD